MTTRFRYGSGKLIEDVYKDDLELRLREQSHSVSRGFLPLIKRRHRHCLNSLLLRSGNFAGYIEVLFHTLYYNWGRKYRSLYRGLRYIEFCYIEVPWPLYEREWEIGLTPLPRFWILSQFAHSHPFESRIFPTTSPLPPANSLLQRFSPTLL